MNTTASRLERSLPQDLGARRRTPSPLRLGMIALAGLIAGWSSQAQTDNFDDGNDNGWTRYAPLAPFGAGATYSFPSGGYRILAAMSPDVANLGPARAGSLRGEVVYTRFKVAVDLAGWDTNLNEAIGIIARATDVGLGTTDGYTFNYNTGSGYLQINLAVNEVAAATLVEAPFRLEVTNCHRLVFSGAGGDLLGQVFAAGNPQVPLASIFVTDDTYAQGIAGVFGFDLSNVGPMDTTFDNYEAVLPGTLRATVASVAPLPDREPPGPVDEIIVRILNRETSVDADSIELEVDGVAVAAAVSVDTATVTLNYIAPVSLAPDTTHRAKLGFNDGQGLQTTEWSFGPPSQPTAPKLVTATKVSGPYVDEPAAVLDATAKTIALPRPIASRFYQLQSDTVRRITSIRIDGNQLILAYQ